MFVIDENLLDQNHQTSHNSFTVFVHLKKMFIVEFVLFKSNFFSRCGENFCSVHRYPEVHSCSFDYKAEGRKLIEQSNPVVSAPKLPKI